MLKTDEIIAILIFKFEFPLIVKKNKININKMGVK